MFSYPITQSKYHSIYFRIYIYFFNIYLFIWLHSVYFQHGGLFVGLTVFSSCGTQAWLPHGRWDLSSQTRDQTHVPCIGRQILNHWTTKEVPLFPFVIVQNSNWCVLFEDQSKLKQRVKLEVGFTPKWGDNSMANPLLRQ